MSNSKFNETELINKEKKRQKKIRETFLDLFFPSFCISCSRIGTFLCENCQKEIVEVTQQSCPRCNRVSKKGKYCSRCRHKTNLSGILAFGYFKDPILKEIVHVYKYEKISGLKVTIAEMMIKSLKKEKLKFDIVFFVPVTRKREAWRGFNQAKSLANIIAESFGCPMGKLIKKKETKTQVGLPKRERERNLQGVFECQSGEVKGKRVLLVDDVVTTGATLNECAKVLRGNGAREVWGVVFAKE